MQRRYRNMAVVAGALVLAGAGVAMAGGAGWGGGWGGHGMMGGPHGGGMRIFELFDTDKDGKVTAAEMIAVRDARFDRFDTNKDGMLSLDEYQALWLDAMHRDMVRQFQRHDEDGNAEVTKEEFNDRFTVMIERLDDNGDGAVTRDEVRPPRRPGPPGPGGPGGPGRHGPDDDGPDDQ